MHGYSTKETSLYHESVHAIQEHTKETLSLSIDYKTFHIWPHIKKGGYLIVVIENKWKIRKGGLDEVVLCGPNPSPSGCPSLHKETATTCWKLSRCSQVQFVHTKLKSPSLPILWITSLHKQVLSHATSDRAGLDLYNTFMLSWWCGCYPCSHLCRGIPGFRFLDNYKHRLSFDRKKKKKSPDNLLHATEGTLSHANWKAGSNESRCCG